MRIIMANMNIKKLTHVLSKKNEVLFAFLFGSQAKARPRPGSDVDIAVYLKDG